MPVVGISVERLHALLRAPDGAPPAEELLDQIGCDVDSVVTVRRYRSRHSDYMIELKPQDSIPLSDPHSGFSAANWQEVWEEVGSETQVLLDLLPVRPDLFDAGGLSRALRGYLGVEKGLRDYSAAAPAWRVEVDERITDPRWGRPLIQCAIVRGLSLDDSSLRSIMRLQENLHWALCRNRKFASIGAYDLAKLENPIRYTLVDREAFSFTPLFWGGREPVSPETMLKEHAKGVEFAHIVAGLSELPALIAANDVVLSLPPVINADESKVTTATRDIFLDVTGSSPSIVTKALAILATSLVELDPTGQARLERVEIVYPDRSEATPALSIEHFEVHPERASRIIGVELSSERCRELLERMRHGVEEGSQDKVQGSGENRPEKASDSSTSLSDEPSTLNLEALRVSVAAYRNDIMHEVDLIEDIAIAYGYHNMQPRLVPSFTAGEGLPINARSRRAATALCGLGFTEVLSLVLTSERDHYEKLLRQPSERRVTLENPISVDQTMLREHLYSPLLELLSMNTDHPLPQRIFEVGDVVRYFEDLSDDRPLAAHIERPLELRVAAAAIADTHNAGYAAGRAVLDALLSELGFPAARLSYRASANPSALPGRSAEVLLLPPEDADAEAAASVVAEVFEVHPQVLANWGIKAPAVMLAVLLGEAGMGH